MLWYLPGILVRSWKEGKAEEKAKLDAKTKAELQAKAIAKLYPNEKSAKTEIK